MSFNDFKTRFYGETFVALQPYQADALERHFGNVDLALIHYEVANYNDRGIPRDKVVDDLLEADPLGMPLRF